MQTISPAKKFIALVQAQTAVISCLPYIIGCLFAYYYYHNFNLVDNILLILAVVAFHFAVNGHNQYTDYFRYQNSKDAQDSYNNILVRFKIKLPIAKAVIITLAIFSAAIGIYLTVKTSWILLLIGVVSFAVGYCYSGGPYPILKTPFGELASGLTMGYNITLLAIYINIYNLTPFDNYFWLKGLIVALPAIFVISDVMLGNNICDLKEDIEIGKKTIVYYLGQKKSFGMLIASYVLSYLMIIAAVLMHLVPLITLAVLLTIPLVWQKIKIFIAHPDKATTFFNVLISLQLILFSEILFLALGIWL